MVEYGIWNIWVLKQRYATSYDIPDYAVE